MKALLDVLTKKDCYGCGACANSCNAGAVTMELDDEGFYKPSFDTEKCVHCGICERACPSLNPTYENSEQPDCYALMASDKVRAVSSSGGAFTVIADSIFKKNGYVCGVAYNDGCKTTHHIIIDNKKDMDLLRGSKYIMSNTEDVFRRVKELISEEKYVLFSGVPCQVAGLKSYLGTKADSPYLLTVDLICHGIPSVKAFASYMRDVHANRPIEHLGFKDKEYGWHASMTVGFNKNEIYNMPCETDPYFISYLNGLNKNRTCGKCIFAKIPRQGDITIGDFWGINNYNPEYNDKKGTSVVLFNNDRGRQYINEIKAESKLFEPVPLEYAVNGNSNIVSSPSVKISNSQFLRKLDTRRYPSLVQWGFADNRYDVGIVGIPLYPNFGGTLTYYSLYRSLKDFGYSVALFSRPRSTGRPPIEADEIYNVSPFEKADMKLDFKDKAAMSNYANANCESFVVGSDQLFNSDLYKLFGEIVTLDWVSDNHRKVAYAASFGHSFFWGPENERAKMAHYMQKFDAFSVREEDGVSLAKHAFGVDAEWVLDPVFLCDKKHYVNISKTAVVKNEKPHIFGYILDPSEGKEKILDVAEKTLGLHTELYSEMLYKPSQENLDSAQKMFRHKLLQGKVEDRLYSLINSEFIVADSFHGVCFAIIFNIPFVAILNPLRGATRFYTILGKLGLLDRMVSSAEELKSKPYLLTEKCDFTKANEILCSERQRGLKWLIEAVDPSDNVKKSFSYDDITDEKLNKINKSIQISNIKVNAALTDTVLYTKRNIYDYLDALKAEQNKYAVLISVKDTPGMSLDYKIDSRLAALGLKTSLVDKHWHAYVVAIDGTRVINETLSKKEERVAYIGKLAFGDIKLVSRTYNNGNIGYIGINGTDYSENRRGLNIVVIDRALGEVVDTVCFDTHDPALPYFRFGKRYNAVNPPYIRNEITREAQDSIILPEGLPKENYDIFYCCRLAVERAHGRKIVLWGDNQEFKNVLKSYFGIDVCFVVTNKRASLGSGLHDIAELKNRSREYYVIVPDSPFKNADAMTLVNMGYAEVNDHIFHNIRPIIVKGRNFEKEPYYDIFMNRITGDFSGNSTIILRGFNNVIKLGARPSFAPNGSLTIDCSESSEVTLGNEIRFVGETKITLISSHLKRITVGNNVVFIDNQLRMFGGIGETEIFVGDMTTFNTNTSVHCNGGKKIHIGNDVMFSINIKVMSGDGHSIFDVNTGKNVNSIPSELSECRNSLVIGDHVWIGLNITLLAGTNVGSGSIIGANSLVKGVFPNNCAIGGNPAKVIKKNVAWSRKNSSNNIRDCGIEFVNRTAEIVNEEQESKTALVFGGTKFAGVRLVEKLLERGYKVTIATRGKHSDNFGQRVERVVLDRNDEFAIIRLLSDKYFEYIFDFSVYTAEHVRYTLAHTHCKRYILVSSAAAYDAEGNVIAYRSENMVDPDTANSVNIGSERYAIVKLNSEIILRQKYRKVKSSIVRAPAVIDEDNLSEGTISTRLFFYVEHILKEIPFNERNIQRPCAFVRTTDEADFMIYLAEHDVDGCFNIASDGNITLNDIIRYIEEKTSKKAIITENGEANPFPFGGYLLNLEKAKSVGYIPVNANDWIYNLLDKYIVQIKNEMGIK